MLAQLQLHPLSCVLTKLRNESTAAPKLYSCNSSPPGNLLRTVNISRVPGPDVTDALKHFNVKQRL